MPSDTRRGQARAHAARSEGESAGKAPRPAAAEGDRVRAADGATRDREPGRGKGRGRTRRGASRAPRRAATERMERSGARSASVGAAKGMGTGTGRARAPAVQARARLTGSGTHGTDRATEAWEPERDPRTRARAPRAPGNKQDGAWEPCGAVRARRGGRGAGRPHSRTCSRCGASPPASNKCRRTTPATTTITTSTTSTPTPETSSPPNPPDPSTSQPPPAPRAEPARMATASAAGGRGAAPAPQAQGPQGEPARGARGARLRDRDWDTVADPLGGEALPLVVEVYGWLSWASSGTAREMRNRPFDAVLLRRDGGNREVPPRGWAASGDHETVLRAVIRAAWPERERTWTAFLEGGAVLRNTDADANNWLPRALRNASTHWRYRRRNPPPPQPQPPHKRRRK